MNKTDRLLAIMLELQRKDSPQRAEDLALALGRSVRTIYRDMQALSEAGVPVIGAPGQGYSLVEGYFLPPVSFTVEEAVALLIGTDFIEQRFDAEYRTKAQSARSKIEAILPETVRKEASRVRTTMKLLHVASKTVVAQEAEAIEVLRRAILEERKVHFRYVKKIPEADGNRQGVRVVAPYGLVHVNGSWILIAYCDLRQELRHFRLSRMDELVITEEGFSRPLEFNLHTYKPLDDRNQLVRIQVHPNIADKVRESNYFFTEAMEDHPEGLLVTLRVRQPEEVLSWVLGWGSDVVVLEPESLRKRMREEVGKMAKRY
jgi:predicted DNA-binding transcriptional regulator YafY